MRLLARRTSLAASAAAASGLLLTDRDARQQPAAETTLFCSWFCPYAQRVWIALEEKGVPFRYVEINPYEDALAPGAYTKTALSLEEKRRRYPDFVAASPRGLVPALCHAAEEAVTVCDSMVMLEYVDEAWEHAPLLPETPAERARVRYWSVFANEKIIPFYYRLLMARDEPARAAAAESLRSGLVTWAGAMAKEGDGPYFLGPTFSYADLMLFPWVERLYTVARAYRGFELIPPADAPRDELVRLHSWYHACRARPSVARTLADEKQLIANYAGYADDTATSDVAKRFRTTKGG